MRSYHFNLGESGKEPIGFSARVMAETMDEAVAKMRAALPPEFEMSAGAEGIEYITIYFNPDSVSADDIDESHGIDEDA
jgi:hypothetical protein